MTTKDDIWLVDMKTGEAEPAVIPGKVEKSHAWLGCTVLNKRHDDRSVRYEKDPDEWLYSTGRTWDYRALPQDWKSAEVVGVRVEEEWVCDPRVKSLSPRRGYLYTGGNLLVTDGKELTIASDSKVTWVDKPKTKMRKGASELEIREALFLGGFRDWNLLRIRTGMGVEMIHQGNLVKIDGGDTAHLVWNVDFLNTVATACNSWRGRNLWRKTDGGPACIKCAATVEREWVLPEEKEEETDE